MKSQFFALAMAGLAVAQPHNHPHQRLHAARRDASTAVDVVAVPGPTVVSYELNGLSISQAEVEEGVKNGTLVMENGGKPAQPSPSMVQHNKQYSAPQASSSASSAPASSSSAYSAPPPTTSSSSSAPAPSSSAPAPSSSASSSSSQGSSSNDDGNEDTSGCERPFDDNSISCNHFPSDYGATYISYLNKDGWIGIQNPGSDGKLHDGTSCEEGSYCSYACPAGFQKSQWPKDQPSSGESLGGLLCKNGKLQLTNEDSKTLCIRGTDKVSVRVENKMGKSAAVCRTDYPGTESETVPLGLASGQTKDLTCPDSSSYYFWSGKSTSAQYYVNPAGTDPEKGCSWGNEGAGPYGNFAPMNLGVGFTDGLAWLALFPNFPTTSVPLDFKVELVAEDPTYKLSARCRYENGVYYKDDVPQAPGTGCTASLPPGGSAKYVFE